MTRTRKDRLRAVATTLGFALALSWFCVWVRLSLFHVQLVAHECLAPPATASVFTHAFSYFSPVPTLVANLATALAVLGVVLSLVGRPSAERVVAATRAFATACLAAAGGLLLLQLVVLHFATEEPLSVFAMVPILGPHVAALGFLALFRWRPSHWAAGAVILTALGGVAVSVALYAPLLEAFAGMPGTMAPTLPRSLVGAAVAAGFAIVSALLATRAGSGTRNARTAALVSVPPFLTLNAFFAVGHLGAYHSLCAWDHDEAAATLVTILAWVLSAAVAGFQVLLAVRRRSAARNSRCK